MNPGREAFIAVDIGASSGRVILGRIDHGRPLLEVVCRFPNGPLRVDGALRWDAARLFEQVVSGLKQAADRARELGERVVSIGVDTWAVDYGLLDDGGELPSQPHSYRDDRTLGTLQAVHRRLPFERLYSVTGLQFLPFNTIYQLAAEPFLTGKQALLMPDLIGYWLTGRRACEITNASTTGLLDAAAGEWALELLDALQLPRNVLASLIQPGDTLGPLLPSIAEQTGLGTDTSVVAVGSHDTASAVAAVPASGDAFAYISSGTWSLVGVELGGPILTTAGRAANFTNERGIDGTTRYLRNVGGLWLLQECMRTWTEEGLPVELDTLLAGAAELPPGGPVIDADADTFIPPGGMPERIREAAVSAGRDSPGSPAAVVRCILDSLAQVYATTVHQAAALSGQPVDVIHIVGGGSQNRLLCQLTADATGLPVMAGPVEATALGNVMVQAKAAGVLEESGPTAIRDAVRRSADMDSFHPSGALQTGPGLLQTEPDPKAPASL